jgi:hypothetical protein
MTKTTRVRITIQTERLLVIGHSRSLYGLCVGCGDEVRMATIDQAAALRRSSSLEVYRLIEAGHLHFMETPEGSLLVCLNSLNGSTINSERMK